MPWDAQPISNDLGARCRSTRCLRRCRSWPGSSGPSTARSTSTRWPWVGPARPSTSGSARAAYGPPNEPVGQGPRQEPVTAPRELAPVIDLYPARGAFCGFRVEDGSLIYPTPLLTSGAAICAPLRGVIACRRVTPPDATVPKIRFPDQEHGQRHRCYLQSSQWMSSGVLPLIRSSSQSTSRVPFTLSWLKSANSKSPWPSPGAV